MSVPLSRMVALALAVLVLGAATSASARPKKHIQRAERTATAAATTNCYGTPIIMQGMDCPRRTARGEGQGPEQVTKRAARHRVTRRGSSGACNPALLSPPSLPLSQPSAGA